MNKLPDLIQQDTGLRSTAEAASFEWRLITRGTRAVRARIWMNAAGARVSSGRICYGAPNGETATAALGDTFTVEPGDLIQAFFDVIPDGSRSSAEAVAVLATDTGEHHSPPALISVERVTDASVSASLFEIDNRQVIEVVVTAKTPITQATLELDPPDQLTIEPILLETGPLAVGEASTLSARVELDDDAAISLANARVLIDGIIFALPPMLVTPTPSTALYLSVGGPPKLSLGEVGEAWIRVANNSKRARIAIPIIDADGISVARSPEPRTVPAGGSTRWTISIAGTRQGGGSLTAHVGALTQSCDVMVTRSNANVAVRGAASFDNGTEARYTLTLSVRDFAPGSRIAIIPAPGMTPDSVVGLGGTGVVTSTYPSGLRFFTNAVNPGDDTVTLEFASTTIDQPGDHQGSILLFENTGSGEEHQIAAHPVIVRGRAIVANCEVSPFDRQANPGEESSVIVRATNKGSANAALPFHINARSFVDFVWEDGTPLTPLITILGQSTFERKLIAHLQDVPAGTRSTTVALTVGTQTFARMITVRNPASVSVAHVQPHENGFEVAFANDGAVAAQDCLIVVRGADLLSASDAATGRTLPRSESRIFCGSVAAGAAMLVAIEVERYHHAEVQVAVIMGHARVDMAYCPPNESIMSFGDAGISFADIQMDMPPAHLADGNATDSSSTESEQLHDDVPSAPLPTFADLAQAAIAHAQGQTQQFDDASTTHHDSDDLHDDTAASTVDAEPHVEEETVRAEHDMTDQSLPEGEAEHNDAVYAHDNVSTTTDEEMPLLTADNFLDPASMRILFRLRSLPSQTRAIHAYVASLFVDGGAHEGSTLRQNIVRALASEAIGDEPSSSWTIMPEEAREWLGMTSETDAVAYLAEQLSTTENMEPALKNYLEAIATSYRSLDGLEPDSVRDRLFAPSTQLDSLLQAAIPMEAYA